MLPHVKVMHKCTESVIAYSGRVRAICPRSLVSSRPDVGGILFSGGRGNLTTDPRCIEQVLVEVSFLLEALEATDHTADYLANVIELLAVSGRISLRERATTDRFHDGHAHGSAYGYDEDQHDDEYERVQCSTPL